MCVDVFLKVSYIFASKCADVCSRVWVEKNMFVTYCVCCKAEERKVELIPFDLRKFREKQKMGWTDLK